MNDEESEVGIMVTKSLKKTDPNMIVSRGHYSGVTIESLVIAVEDKPLKYLSPIARGLLKLKWDKVDAKK